MATVAVLDYFFTLDDEVRDPSTPPWVTLTHWLQINYMWKKRRSWTFYAFITVSRFFVDREG